MKKNKIILNPKNILEINKYKKEGITSFFFPLKDYAIGFDNYFTIEEVNNCQENNYLFINKILNTKDIISLEKELKCFKGTGIIFHDLGAFNICKSFKFDKIYLGNHLLCNYQTINYFLNIMDNIVISNELNKNEIKEILLNINNKPFIWLMGYNMAMYSKRLLISNYAKHYQKKMKKDIIVNEKVSKELFKIYEEKEGTTFLSGYIFNHQDLLKEDDFIGHYLINTSFIDFKDVIDYINNLSIDNSNNGFLEKKLITKVGDSNE